MSTSRKAIMACQGGTFSLPIEILTDRGMEYCGNREHHEYRLYLALEDIAPSITRAKSPQSNGIVERFQRAMLNEFYRVAFRKEMYRSVEELQEDVCTWIRHCNEERPHSGRYCFGETPMQTFLNSLPMAREKMHGYEPESVMV